MSAVMSTLSMISGGRRSYQKLSKKSSRKSGQYSDFGEDREREREPRKELKEQRSASLQTLETNGNGVAHLETLEAKMANIEESLVTRRRSVMGPAGGTCVSPARSSAPTAVAIAAPARELDALRAALRDKDSLIVSLKEQLSTTMSINRISASLSRAGSPGGGTGSGGAGAGGALAPEERRTLEERASATRRDAEEKRTAIATLKQALEKLHVTDNIDTRIQQAELEYQLGREELELLTLMQQARALQLLLETDTHRHHTLYSCVREMEGASLVTAEVDYDAKSPSFSAGTRRGAPGLWLDWARDDTPLSKGDRLVEVNGAVMVSCKSGEELWRAVAISPRPARLVLLRPASHPPRALHQDCSPSPPRHAPQVVTLRAEVGALREQACEALKAKEGLRADNLRLTHRISYLEEQVAELLARDRVSHPQTPGGDAEVKVVTGEKNVLVNKTKKNVTNINITSGPAENKHSAVKSDVQVFQKGPDITALVANLPGLEAGGKNTAETSANLPVIRPKSNMSNVSSTHIASSPGGNRARSVTSVDQSESERRPSSREHLQARRAHRQSLDSYALQHSKSSHSLDHRCKEKLDYATERRAHKMRQSLSQHCLSKDHRTMDYQAETAAALEIIKNNQKLYMDSPLRAELKNDRSRSNDNFNADWDARNSHSKSDFYRSDNKLSDTNIEHSTDLTKVKKTNWAEKKTLSIIEQLKKSQRLRKSKSTEITTVPKTVAPNSEDTEFHPEHDYVYHRIDGKVLENTHKSNRRLSKMHARNVKSLDFESENSDFPNGEVYNSPKLLDYTSEPGSAKLSYYKKRSQSSSNGDVKARPLPPKKPLRLSLHRAQSTQSIGSDQVDSCAEFSSNSELNRLARYMEDSRDTDGEENHRGDCGLLARLQAAASSPKQSCRKPAKRNHKGDRFLQENPSGTSPKDQRPEGTRNQCATPKPSKKLNGLSSYGAPAADDLYPNTPNCINRDTYDSQQKVNGTGGYSPRAPTRSESVGSRTSSRADSAHSEVGKWPPSTPPKSHTDHFRFNGHLSPRGKWC